MIFVDTSAIFAFLDRHDLNHKPPMGVDAVRSIPDDLLPVMEIVWVDEATHLHAIAALLAAQRRKLSLVDCVSFTVMRARGSQTAFAFDRHFSEERVAFPAG